MIHFEQMWGGVGAVFASWNGKAIEYRRIEKIPHEWGTAVNVQAMVFVIWVTIVVPVLPLPATR